VVLKIRLPNLTSKRQLRHRINNVWNGSSTVNAIAATNTTRDGVQFKDEPQSVEESTKPAVAANPTSEIQEQ
jgi:hypothetical protein